MIEVSDSHSKKQYSPRLVTVEGILVFLHPTTIIFFSVSIIALQSSRESKVVLFSSTRIEEREGQPPKQISPKLVTDSGIVMDASNEQP